MENIKELRKKVQGDRIKTHEWYGRLFSRKISIYISWILLQTSITANQVTFMMIIMGWLASIFFAIGSPLFFLIGVLFFQIWWLLDNVDGEIAVYRRECNLTGIYFDVISHYLVHPFIMLSIGVGLYRGSHNYIYILIGGMAGFSNLLLDLIQHAKYYVMFEKYFKNPNLSFSNKAKTNPGGSYSKLSLLGWLLKQYCLYPGVMNLITLAAMMDFIIYVNDQHLPFTILGTLLISYSIFYPISCLKTLTQMILRKDIDREFSYYFKNEKE